MRRTFFLVLCFSATAAAQDPEVGRVERHGNESVLIVKTGRPLDSAAITLASQFGIRVNVEDPPYIYADDVRELTAEEWGNHPGPHARVPRGVPLEIRFPVRPDGYPADVPGLIRTLVWTANANLPFAYRWNSEGDWYTITPTKTRGQSGRSIEIMPLLDHPVTIPAGVRPIMESANLMAEALSSRTGLRVSCCQSFVAGVPWGLQTVSFEARDEPARSVLKRLIALSVGDQPTRIHWLQRCDALPSRSCFIDLRF